MDRGAQTFCTAFEGTRRIATGELALVALKTKEVIDGGDHALVLIFDDETSRPIEVDFRGTAEDVLRRLPQGEVAPIAPEVEPPRGGPGRPKLGVVAREVTLLPRHWEWLNGQPGGASVALRKLVEASARANEGRDRVRRSQEAAYRFMSALAGNLPGFEEATRALFAENRQVFDELVEAWPVDIKEHAWKLSVGAFQDSAGS
jgi:uncharacterized protein